MKKDMKKDNELHSERPVMAVLDLLGRRWALRILWELRDGPQTFRPLQTLCGGISPTVMSKRLAELRDAKIIARGQGEGYSITSEGLRVCSALMQLNNWANEMAKPGSFDAGGADSGVQFCPHCGMHLKPEVIEDKTRLACPDETCGYVFWDNPVPVVAAVVEHNGAILLARNTAWPEKVFGLITGFLEKNETTEDAVKREVKEELGLDSVSVEFIGIYSFFEMNQTIIGYHVRADGEITLGDELAEVKPVEIGKLKAWPFGTGFIVQTWLEKRNTQ